MMTVTVSKLIWVFGIIAWYVIRLPHQRRAGRIAVERDAGSGVDQLVLIVALWGQFLIPLSYVAVSVTTGQRIPGDYTFQPWQGWAGLVVLGAALALFRLTHKQLGRNWSVALETRSDHTLVTNGVYAYVRHPMYTSFLLSAFAQALLLPNWIAGSVGLIAFALLFLSRIKREEAMMLETFGDSYRAYQSRTARIVPWLY